MDGEKILTGIVASSLLASIIMVAATADIPFYIYVHIMGKSTRRKNCQNPVD